MARISNKLAVFALSAALIGSTVLGSTLASAAENNGAVVTHANLQLIADQLSVGAGGNAKFHIIYHNVENKNHSHVWVKVKLPVGLELNQDDLEELDNDNSIEKVVWDAATRTLTWKINDIKPNGATVIHFTLKVNGNLSTGSVHTLVPEMIAADGTTIQVPIPPLSIKIGPQIDQPFFKGFPDGEFKPVVPITRGEMAAVVSRIKNLDENVSLVKEYTDIANDHWAYNYVKAVTNSGFMKGFEDGSFRADQPITRAELVALVLRLRGITEVPLGSFSDIDDHWAQNIIGTAKALKIIDGLTPDSFDPNGVTERQHAAKLINKALFRGPLVDGDAKVIQHFPDVPTDHWAFHWIEEASMVAHEAEYRSSGMEHLIRYLPEQTERF